jgi:hypothetical protein
VTFFWLATVGGFIELEANARREPSSYASGCKR